MSENKRVFSESQVPLLRSLPTSLFGSNGSSSLLSSRQLSELNASVLQYLKPILQAEPDVYSKVETELLKTEENSNKYASLTGGAEIPENYLQKKWSTVLRLQRNLQELEMKNNSLEQKNKELIEELERIKENPQSGRQVSSINKLNWIPSILKSSLQYHTSPISAIAIHPFNPYLITASQDGLMVFWSLLDLSQPVAEIKAAHSKSINCLIFQPNTSNLISCSSDQLIKVWDVSNINKLLQTPIKILSGHDHIVSSLCISSTHPSTLLSCSRDNTIKVWNIDSGWNEQTVKAHSDWVRSIDACGEYVISCSSDTSIRLTHYPTLTGVGICLGHQHVIEDVIFLPESSNVHLDKLLKEKRDYADEDESYKKLKFKYAVSCGRDKLIKFWKLPVPDFNTVTGRPSANMMNPYGECILELMGHQSWVKNLTVHYNGQYLLSCSDDRTIKIWDMGSFASQLQTVKSSDIKPFRVLSAHQSFVNKITLASPKGELVDDNIRCYLVSGGSDNLVNVWI